MSPAWRAIACGVWLLAACQPTTGPPQDPPAPAVARAAVSSLSFEEFFTLHDSGKLLLIDARTTYHYQLGHIPGATHFAARREDLSIESLRPQLEAAATEHTPVVIYCSGYLCGDARKLAQRISKAGFPVSIFSGGWNEWKNAGLPVESASQAPVPSATPSAP